MSACIDHDHPAIRALLDARGWRAVGTTGADDEIETARRAFCFVRDEVRHSWDVRSHRVTRTASEALRHGEGLCYSKAMLLAALLRALGIPAGLAYQRLTFGDTPAEGYSLHGLTTVYFGSLGRWVRLDARGNKPGVDAQFVLDEDAEARRLAFHVRAELGEVDYTENLPEPSSLVVDALARHTDLHVLIRALPDLPPGAALSAR